MKDGIDNYADKIGITRLIATLFEGIPPDDKPRSEDVESVDYNEDYSDQLILFFKDGAHIVLQVIEYGEITYTPPAEETQDDK